MEDRFVMRAPKDQENGHSFRFTFSPGAKWLVGRQTFAPFITWDVSLGADQIGTLSAGEPARGGSDTSSTIWFSFDGKWVAGLGNNQKLHLWRPSKPPGLKSEAVFPGDYSAAQSRPFVAFSATGNMIAAISPDGNLHVWPLSSGAIGEPVVHHYGAAQVQFSKDDQYVYSADTNNVYVGRVGETMSLVAGSKSRVQAVAVTPDAKSLAIFAENHVIVARRSIYIWDIPIWSLTWPAIAQPLRIH
jgi:WD40 repeat protein